MSTKPTTKEMKVLSARIEKKRGQLAAYRDDLRPMLDDLESLIEDVNQAHNYLTEAKEAIDSAADDLSHTL